MPPVGKVLLSVDVEDYFQVEAFSETIDRKDWGRYEGHVVQNTRRLLQIFRLSGAKGSFFVLGWVAEKHPELVREIHEAGHEVASHGVDHRMITTMSPEEFREDARKSKRILEGITGAVVHGYRAPTFSIVRKTAWAHDILADEGYRYSSSVFPIRHDKYGWPGFGLDPRRVGHRDDATLWEIPLSVGTILGGKVPFGGGGYLRAYPLSLTLRLFRRCMEAGRTPTVYLHPWEIDAAQPAIPGPFLSRLRHYQGISGMERKIRTLLASFESCPIGSSPFLRQ